MSVQTYGANYMPQILSNCYSIELLLNIVNSTVKNKNYSNLHRPGATLLKENTRVPYTKFSFLSLINFKEKVVLEP